MQKDKAKLDHGYIAAYFIMFYHLQYVAQPILNV